MRQKTGELQEGTRSAEHQNSEMSLLEGNNHGFGIIALLMPRAVPTAFPNELKPQSHPTMCDIVSGPIRYSASEYLPSRSSKSRLGAGRLVLLDDLRNAKITACVPRVDLCLNFRNL